MSPRESLSSACRPSSVKLTLQAHEQESVPVRVERVDRYGDSLLLLDDMVQALLDLDLRKRREAVHAGSQ